MKKNQTFKVLPVPAAVRRDGRHVGDGGRLVGVRDALDFLRQRLPQLHSGLRYLHAVRVEAEN